MFDLRKRTTPKLVLAMIAGFSLWAGSVQAVPVQWFFNNLTFEDGATGTGSFFFDGEIPFGARGSITNVDLTISGGSTFPDTTYNSVNPESEGNAEFLWFVVDSNDAQGEPAFAGVLVERMTSAGGSVDFLTTGNPALFSQYLCGNTSGCGLGGTPQNPITGGFVSTSVVPLPAAIWMFGSALLGTGILRMRRRKA